MVCFEEGLEAFLDPSVAKSISPPDRDRNRANFRECCAKFSQ